MQIKIATILLLVLAPLALIQYHWIGKVSKAEKQRMEANLKEAANRFSDTFDREIMSIVAHFLGKPMARDQHENNHIADLVHQWQNLSTYPGLIDEIYLINQPTPPQNGLFKLNLTSGELQESDWPEWMAPLQEQPTMARGNFPRRRAGPHGILWADHPALVLPFMEESLPQNRINRLLGGFHGNRIIITFNMQYIAETLLPDLESRFINPGNKADYAVTVTKNDAAKPVIYATDPKLAAEPGDLERSFFGLKRFPEYEGIFFGTPGPQTQNSKGRNERRARARRHRLPRIFDLEGHWILKITHRTGSLEKAVQRNRLQNLALNLSVFFLLGAGIWMTVRSSQRAKRLADQQLSFVAGISHELLTPLAAIKSAAQNLSDGLVSKDEKVVKYGTMIGGESGRLTDLVEKVLEFAGMQSEAKSYHFEKIPLEPVIHQVVEDCQLVLEKASFEIQLELTPDLPMVHADAAALNQALQNLIGNAVKYAPDSPFLHIRVYGSSDGYIVIEVEDSGPGISEEDLPHVFEPFYRGAEAKASQIKGSGLGLCLVANIVQAHGGTITVTKPGKQGALFKITLPVDGPAS